MRRAILALLTLALLPACTPEGELVPRFTAGRFNERLRPDLKGLDALEQVTDLRYGTFRSGGGLVSEIWPLVGDGVPERLVQADCLWLHGGQEVRLAWEAVGKIDRSLSELNERFVEGHEELGLCSTSSPEQRLLFEDPYRGPCSSAGCGCRGALNLPRAVTLPRFEKNIPWECFWQPISNRVVLEELPRREADPDSSCPGGSGELHPPPIEFWGDPLRIVQGVSGFTCETPGDWAPNCAPACGFQPERDVSLRVSLDPTAFPAEIHLGSRERFLSPNLLVFQPERSLVRPMKGTGTFWEWQTPVTEGVRVGQAETTPVRWNENFSPTLVVESVQVLSRTDAGEERVERPSQDRLTMVYPEGNGTASLTCTGRERDGEFGFLVYPKDSSPGDCATDNQPAPFVTPTYRHADLNPVRPVPRAPLKWQVDFSPSADRALFLRFFLREQIDAAAWRMSPPWLHFGRLRVGDSSAGRLQLENVGGQPVRIDALGFIPAASPQASDFSFFTIGDAVGLPLPFTSDSDGVVRRTDDYEDAALFTFEETSEALIVTLGTPGHVGDEEVKVYGDTATLRGGTLLRDPAASYTPADPTLERLRMPAYLERQPPFTLGPGEVAEMVVTATPSDVGDRIARLRFDWTDLSRPWVSQSPLEVALSVEGRSGPILVRAPESSLTFARGVTPPGQPVRRLLLTNSGHSGMTRLSVRVQGPDAARFQVTATSPSPLQPLASGEANILTVTYEPECDGSYTIYDHEAQLLVESDGGDEVVPIYGSSYEFCE